MRLGQYPCVVRPGSLADTVYSVHGTRYKAGDNPHEPTTENHVPRTIFERHRHRFEFNPLYREQMEAAGFIVSATSPDGMLAEVVELRDHPYMIATQAHPELISRPTHPHPLFI